MSGQNERIAVDSLGQHALTVKEGPAEFPGSNEEFFPRDLSALDIMERVQRQCKWTAPKTTETWIRMWIA